MGQGGYFDAGVGFLVNVIQGNLASSITCAIKTFFAL